jgi:hypothetical protein
MAGVVVKDGWMEMVKYLYAPHILIKSTYIAKFLSVLEK